MSESGSTTTKPVPAPRRGRKPKEPSAPASDTKLQNVRPLFQNTVRQFYEWMDKLGKCVCCAYQKRRNVTKVGRPTEKRTFRCPRRRRIFLHKSWLSVRSKGSEKLRCDAFANQGKQNTPTDNEQLLRLKRMSSKSPHSDPLLRDQRLCKSLLVRIETSCTLTSWGNIAGKSHIRGHIKENRLELFKSIRHFRDIKQPKTLNQPQ